MMNEPRLVAAATTLALAIGAVGMTPGLFRCDVPPSTGSAYQASSRTFVRETAGSFDRLSLPQIAHVQVVDCDGDGHYEKATIFVKQNAMATFHRCLSHEQPLGKPSGVLR